ncbi:MAG: hypothetical protein CME62_09545 [Halobacteriovoraceae bacterium]|nr:hypothetical protein [Halobacteriovoraceae bacterium]
MFRRVYNRDSGKVAENDNFNIYVYRHPLESGQEKWHVHFVRKSDGSDAKISLWDFSLMRPTSFDRDTIKAFIEWTYINRHFLRRKWVQHVLRPFFKSLGKWRKNES